MLAITLADGRLMQFEEQERVQVIEYDDRSRCFRANRKTAREIIAGDFLVLEERDDFYQPKLTQIVERRTQN